MTVKVGLISDTHGLVRPQALEALQGCNYLIHGGDIGNPEILETLKAIAPLTAVRGNNDTDDAWASDVPYEAVLRIGEVAIYTTHILADVPKALPDEVRVVVTGHSHRPVQQVRDGVLFINPGSAGPRRFKLPITVGMLHINGADVRGELIELTLK
jgi:putative phosphoesterase